MAVAPAPAPEVSTVFNWGALCPLKDSIPARLDRALDGLGWSRCKLSKIVANRRVSFAVDDSMQQGTCAAPPPAENAIICEDTSTLIFPGDWVYVDGVVQLRWGWVEGQRWPSSKLIASPGKLPAKPTTLIALWKPKGMEVTMGSESKPR